jgi:hypothetical protein
LLPVLPVLLHRENVDEPYQILETPLCQ